MFPRLAGFLLATWLVVASVAVGAAQNETVEPSYQLISVLANVAPQLPECAMQCFNLAITPETSCQFVEDFMTDQRMLCLNTNCTTHQYIQAALLVTSTCGTTPRSMSIALTVVDWGLFVLTTVFVGARLIARSSYFGVSKFGSDDWIILIAWVVLVGVTIGVEIMTMAGLGTDVWTQTDQQMEIIGILWFVSEYAYVVVEALVKTSILLLYLRIFTERRFRVLCWSLIGCQCVWAVAYMIGLLLFCKPMTYTWEIWDNEVQGHCVNQDVNLFVCAGIIIVLDLIVWLVPIPQLTKLEMTLRKKLAVSFMFLVGILVTACSAVRLNYIQGWDQSPDRTRYWAILGLVSLIELDIAVICACMPGLASFLNHFRRRRNTALKEASIDTTPNKPRTLSNRPRGKDRITQTIMVSVSREDRTGNRSAYQPDRRDSGELELVDRGKGVSWATVGLGAPYEGSLGGRTWYSDSPVDIEASAASSHEGENDSREINR